MLDTKMLAWPDFNNKHKLTHTTQNVTQTRSLLKYEMKRNTQTHKYTNKKKQIQP